MTDSSKTDGEDTEPSRVVNVEVRWGDCDPAGIAFYPRFFEWMDYATNSLILELGISRDMQLPPNSVGFPLVDARATFLAPARFRDRLEVRTRVTRLGRTSLGLAHAVAVGESGAVVATGTEERVFVSRAENGEIRPRPLTPEMREVLQRYWTEPAEGSN